MKVSAIEWRVSLLLRRLNLVNGFRRSDSDALYAIHPIVPILIRGFPYITGQFEMLIVREHCPARFVPVSSFQDIRFSLPRGKRQGNNVGLNLNRWRYCL